MADFNTKIIEEFREMADGPKDHLVGGMFPHDRLVILHSTGAKSGAERLNPLVHVREGATVYLPASAAGAPKHPDWYHNVIANPDVTIEIGEQTQRMRAEPIMNRAERDRVYAMFVEIMPGFAEYEEKAGDRVIPVVALTPSEG